jgi:glycosyltransferase involved in cell wall biosynthesis
MRIPYAQYFPKLIELEPAPPGVTAKAAAAARMLYSSSSRRGMAHVLADFAPDVVHLHNIYHQLSPSILAATRQAGVPTVMTLHDYKLACPSYQLLDHGETCDACIAGGFRNALRRRCKDGSLGASALLALESWAHRVSGAYDPVHAFISPSRFLADVMSAAGVFPDRMHVVNHFVDVAHAAVKGTAGGPVVFAGRLASEKGVDILIEAIGRLGSRATLEVAGDGPARAELEALAADRAPGQVHFHGRLGKAQLQELVRSSIAMAVPSRWYENQPMTVLESFALGVPVVATRMGGLPELVDSGADGLVVSPNDPALLADALGYLLDDPAGALEMGQVGRRKVERDFTPARHLARLGEVYRRAGSNTTAVIPSQGAR